MSQSVIGKDVAGLIKEATDPITYGRLLQMSKIFSNVNENRKKRKLQELFASLPSGKTPRKARTAYNFYYYDRKKELEQEHCLLGSDKPLLYKAKIGEDWKELSTKRKRPWLLKSLQDKTRFHSQTIPGNWKYIQSHRDKVLRELSTLSDDAALIAFKEIRYKKLLRRQHNINILKNNYRDNLISWRTYTQQKKRIFLENPVPTLGKNALNIFTKENCDIIKSAFVTREHLPHTFQEIAGNMWGALSSQEQSPYRQKSHEDCVNKARKVIFETSETTKKSETTKRI